MPGHAGALPHLMAGGLITQIKAETKLIAQMAKRAVLHPAVVEMDVTGLHFHVVSSLTQHHLGDAYSAAVAAATVQ